MGTWRDEACLYTKDWLATIFVGFLTTSYWRGTWVLFDLWLCDQPTTASLATADSFCFAGVIEPEEINIHRKSGWYSIAIGFSLTVLGVAMMWAGWWRPKVVDIKEEVHLPIYKTVIRFLIVYILGMAAVNIWRGVWYLTDFYLLPNTLTANEWGEFPLTSYWVSSVVGSTVCFILFAGNSILAPPGIFLIDGPGVNPPPIAVTVLSSYFSITLPAGSKVPDLPFLAYLLDILLSFVGIPIMVVWFWRGSWLVLDFYLYGFSPDPRDVHLSIAWSTILGIGLMFLTSETVFAFIKVTNNFILAALGRLRTYVLAWGVVNFWRAVWYIWDEFMGGTTHWSAWISHAAPLVVLTIIGCVSCILAPASTMGVDFVPDPLCADEPLFSMLPCPADDLYVFGIGRQPHTLDEKELPKEALENQKHHVRMSVSVAQLSTQDLEDLETSEVEMAELPPEATEKAEREAAIWSSGGTGRRGSYSSVRSQAELTERRSSYFEIQRPDLDRRVSRTASITSSGATGSAVRRSSDLFRNR